jgi:multiple antibiotic resistance protein
MILLTYLAFNVSDIIVKKLGKNIITVIGKIMGLILAIMGTGMVVEGIKLAFKL